MRLAARPGSRSASPSSIPNTWDGVSWLALSGTRRNSRVVQCNWQAKDRSDPIDWLVPHRAQSRWECNKITRSGTLAGELFFQTDKELAE